MNDCDEDKTIKQLACFSIVAEVISTTLTNIPNQPNNIPPLPYKDVM